MRVENELKMIPREDVNPEKVLKLLTDKEYSVQGNLKIGRQEDTYYDDNQGTLEKNNCSFRIRRKGEKAIVTCKIPVESDTAYKQRKEMEVEIPKIYIQKDGTIFVEDAIDVLKKAYPEIKLPPNMQFVVKVINNRNKVNVQAPDGTIIELSFDDLHTQDSKGNDFRMKDEIECEVLSGEPSNLENIHSIIEENFDIQRNELSKYSRAIKEMREQKSNLSMEEIALCVMFSEILKSQEFEQLKLKGQMIHNFRGLVKDGELDFPENLKLDNFKDPEYLINKISELRRTKDYKIGRVKTLEDMFLCFFSDMDYKDLEYKLVNFLNDNYYNENKPITNRMLHSQQVMLITGLISNTKEISESERKPLHCMVSALAHDIGHVPGAHPTEEVLADFDGFFSHEINGRNVVERIMEQNREQIIDKIQSYYQAMGQECDRTKIEEYVNKNKEQIKKSIEAHSRTNSEKRGEGTVVQLPREADKIAYAISDIVDIYKKLNLDEQSDIVKFFPQEWKDEVIEKLGKGYEAKEDDVRKKVATIQTLIEDKNFGRLATSIANTIRENVNDGKTYYDVEQDTWDILTKMIAYVKNIRKEKIVDSNRDKLQTLSRLFVIKTFNECLQKCSNNIDVAWDKTLDIITKSNDTNILNNAYKIKEQFKNKEDLQEACAPGGILDVSLISKLDNADRQIKIQPRGKFQMSDILPFLGSKYDIPPAEHLRDEYYKNQNEVSICVREDADTQKKKIIAKRKRDKAGVTQVERSRYETEEIYNGTLQELIEKCNQQYPELNLNIPTENPKCVIETIRNKVENEQGIEIRRDRSKIITGSGEIEMPETIEIECRDRNMIKKVKGQISTFLDIMKIQLRDIATKESKEEQAIRLIEEQEQSK